MRRDRCSNSSKKISDGRELAAVPRRHSERAPLPLPPPAPCFSDSHKDHPHPPPAYQATSTAPTPFTGCPVLYRRLSGSHCDSLTSLDMARVRRLHQCPRSSGQLLPAQPNYFYSINSNCATFCHVAWEIPVGSASQGRRCSNDKTNNYYATICASEQEHSPCKGPRVLKRGPRHQVLIAVQAPWNRAEQHTAPAATAPRAASAAGARRRNRQGMRPSFPLGVEISSSSTNSASFLLPQYTARSQNVRWTCPSGRWLGMCYRCLSTCPRTRRSTSARATDCAGKRAFGNRVAARPKLAPDRRLGYIWPTGT